MKHSLTFIFLIVSISASAQDDSLARHLSEIFFQDDKVDIITTLNPIIPYKEYIYSMPALSQTDSIAKWVSVFISRSEAATNSTSLNSVIPYNNNNLQFQPMEVSIADLFKKGNKIRSCFSIHKTYGDSTLIFYSGCYMHYSPCPDACDTVRQWIFLKNNRFVETTTYRDATTIYNTPYVNGDFKRIKIREKGKLVLIYKRWKLKPFRRYKLATIMMDSKGDFEFRLVNTSAGKMRGGK